MNRQLQSIIEQIEAGQFKEAYNALKMMRKDPTLSEEILEVVEIASIEIGVTEKRMQLEPNGGFMRKAQS